MNIRRLRLLTAALVMGAVLSACATMGQLNPLDAALYDYSSQIRWSEFDNAAMYMEPAPPPPPVAAGQAAPAVAAAPADPLAIERLKQYQVSGYEVKTFHQPAEDLFEQTVEIRIINRHTQAERTILDHQRWRYDPVAERWWLTSGLPDVTDRN